MDTHTPPQPPATPNPPAVHAKQLVKQQAEYRFNERGRAFTLRVLGDVRPDTQGGLHFAPGAALAMQITTAQGSTTLTWDARACRLAGQHSGPCAEADKAAAVAALARLPQPPAPPRG